MTDNVAGVEIARLENDRLEFGRLVKDELQINNMDIFLRHTCDMFSCNDYDNLYALVD